MKKVSIEDDVRLYINDGYTILETLITPKELIAAINLYRLAKGLNTTIVEAIEGVKLD